MNIKHMFITIVGLLPITGTFNIYGMLISKKALSMYSQQQILQNCGQALQKNTNITNYDQKRDEKIITSIASAQLPKLLSDITPKNHTEMLNKAMNSLNNDNGTISKVYLFNNKPIGFINYYITQPRYTKFIPCTIGPTAHINFLAIDNEHQGKGIGSALLRYAINDCGNHSVHKIILFTTDWKLVKYYQRLGFSHRGGSKYTGVDKLVKELQTHPTILLYKAMRKWISTFKE